MPDKKTHPFVTYLESLAEDRGALAALRRGLGQPPGTVAAMYPYVVPRLPANAERWLEDAYYLIAALYAMHPTAGGSGNMGSHFRRAAEADPERREAIERRFTRLLAAHPDDLPDALRQAVGYLRSAEVPIHWHQLLRDVLAWGHPERYVQRSWAKAFWRPKSDSPDSNT